jgi:hypothetical protein
LLVNDVRIQLVQLGRLMRAIRIRFLAPTSPYLRKTGDGRLMTHERIERWPGANEWIEFISDGVLTLRHETLGKTLLFFLEVDRGTEPLSTRGKRRACMQVKFDNYQKFFRGAGYKRYENVCDSALRGFRVLVITTTDVRLAALCRLLREVPSSDFVWLTTRNQLIERGCWAPIWTMASRSDDSPLSILGSQTPRPCPGPSELANAGRRT